MGQRNYNASTIDVIADIQLGIRVSKAAANIAAAKTPIFTITGGKILMTAFFGVIATAAAGATTIVLSATPTGLTAQPVAASLDIDPALVGDVLTITGIANAPMTYNASTTGLPMMSSKGVILSPGTLDYTGGQASGAVAWTMFYVPLDDGAYVTAV
jgi:hypothetical protein